MANLPDTLAPIGTFGASAAKPLLLLSCKERNKPMRLRIPNSKTDSEIKSSNYLYKYNRLCRQTSSSSDCLVWHLRLANRITTQYKYKLWNYRPQPNQTFQPNLLLYVINSSMHQQIQIPDLTGVCGKRSV